MRFLCCKTNVQWDNTVSSYTHPHPIPIPSCVCIYSTLPHATAKPDKSLPKQTKHNLFTYTHVQTDTVSLVSCWSAYHSCLSCDRRPPPTQRCSGVEGPPGAWRTHSRRGRTQAATQPQLSPHLHRYTVSEC